VKLLPLFSNLSKITLTCLCLLAFSTIALAWDEKAISMPAPIPADQLNYGFGKSVDIDSNYAVVGSTTNAAQTGEAHVLFFDGTSWSIVAKLTASLDTNDFFGASVGISGDIIIVSSSGDDDKGAEAGAVYLYKKPAGGWINADPTAKLTASDADQGDNFGTSVCIDGDYLVIGSPNDSNDIKDAGAVYLFTKPLLGWSDTTETAKLLASDRQASDHLGTSVAICGDHVVASSQTNEQGTNSGSAYIFSKPELGWVDTTQTAQIIASDGAAEDYFGSSVAISDNNLVVGAYLDDDFGNGTGSAYVYTKPALGWKDTTQTAKLLSSNAGASPFFGKAVSIADSIILVGSIKAYTVSIQTGTTYGFIMPVAGWSDAYQSFKLNPLSGGHHDDFGGAISIDSDNIIIGSTGADDNGSASGAAYVFSKPDHGWVDTTENSKIIAPVIYQTLIYNYGDAVAIDGDYSVISSPLYGGQLGIVHVLFFNGTTWETVAELTASNGVAGDYFGTDVAISGNNIVIGAFRANISGPWSGAAYVYTKPTGGWTDMTQTAVLRDSDGEINGLFGYSVAVDGDNIVVGAYGKDELTTDVGAAYVFTKPIGGWKDTTETAKLNNIDSLQNNKFGTDVSISGDYIVVGCFNKDSLTPSYVFKKSILGWVSSHELAKLSPSHGDITSKYFGNSVSISGETIVLGSRNENGISDQNGAAYIYTKPVSEWTDMTETAKLTPSNGLPYSHFGTSVSIDNETVIIGSPYRDSLIGATYIYEKPSEGWVDATEDVLLNSSNTTSVTPFFGIAVAISGRNAVIGSRLTNTYGVGSGEAYLYNKPLLVNFAEISKSLNFTLYPNPSDGSCKLKLSNIQPPCLMQIFTAHGKFIEERILYNEYTELNLNLASGSYFIVVDGKSSLLVINNY